MKAGPGLALVCLLTVALLGIFAAKPFHIDDPYYVRIAQHVQQDPLDFYGLSINWYGVEQPVTAVNQNPPLLAFFMALAASVVGWSEVGLHVALLVPALAAVLGTAALAARCAAPPALAALLALGTPVFFVSATTLMSDLLMLACFVWSVFFWDRGLREGRRADLFTAGLLAACSALSKYFGVALVPLLLAHALTCRERPTGWWLGLLVPMAAVFGYELVTRALYGTGLLSAAAGYAVGIGRGGTGLAERATVGVLFTGGCALTLVLYLPRLFERRERLVVAGAALLAGLLAGSLPSVGEVELRAGVALHWVPMLHAGIFAFAAVVVLALPVVDLLRHRDPSSLLLALWVGGTFCFAALVNWTTNGRAVLPMVPALAILAARRMPGVAWPGAALPVAFSLLLSVWVALGDSRLAASAREAAQTLRERYGPSLENVHFEGHWGFQHYMEGLGASAVDYARSEFEPGDLIVVALNNTNLRRPPQDSTVVSSELQVPTGGWVSTMSDGAGFYTSSWGPFPFVVGPTEPERYRIYEVLRDFRFSGAP